MAFSLAGTKTAPSQRLETVWRFVLRELRRETIWWVPLRLFIAVGWLRACAEKISDPAWYDGSRLTAFLNEHLARGDAALPAYTRLMQDVFLPTASGLAWVVLVGQALVGASLLIGWRTRGALAAGLFMNANFLAAGEPNPSAFYIVMQMALLVGGAERSFALDRCSKPKSASSATSSHLLLWAQLALNVLLLVIGTYGLTRIEDFSAAGSVRDPAAILAVTCFVGLGYAFIATLRLVYGFRPPVYERRQRRRVEAE
jgi:thiosulfate dehydrogenase (quinone) large subunit